MVDHRTKPPPLDIQSWYKMDSDNNFASKNVVIKKQMNQRQAPQQRQVQKQLVDIEDPAHPEVTISDSLYEILQQGKESVNEVVDKLYQLYRNQIDEEQEQLEFDNENVV
jgi:hypothetical protein